MLLGHKQTGGQTVVGFFSYLVENAQNESFGWAVSSQDGLWSRSLCDTPDAWSMAQLCGEMNIVLHIVLHFNRDVYTR